MMKRFFVILISCLWLAVPLFAQSNKLIRELESKRGALQKQIAESESILKDTKKDVGSQLNSLCCMYDKGITWGGYFRRLWNAFYREKCYICII